MEPPYNIISCIGNNENLTGRQSNFPKDYYNFAYHPLIFKRIMFNKFICIKQLL